MTRFLLRLALATAADIVRAPRDIAHDLRRSWWTTVPTPGCLCNGCRERAA